MTRHRARFRRAVTRFDGADGTVGQ